MRKFRSDWGEVRNPNASRRYKPLLRSFDQLQQGEPLRKVKSTTSRGLPLHLCPVRWRTLAAIQIVRNCFPTQGEALSKAENGMPIAPYHVFLAQSTRAASAKPEFQIQPSSWWGFAKSMSGSTHSPCGEISNSLYPRMFWKSAPINTSATSQSQSRNVSVEILGDGLRFSLSLRTDDKKYRFFFVHRDRTSVRWLTRFLPCGPFSA